MQWLIGAFTEEFVSSFSFLKHFQWWDSKHLHDQVQLLHFAFTREDWDARVKLNQDAAETPHVNPGRVRDADDDLWCPVEPRLDVRVDTLVGEAGGTKVNDFDA